MDDNSQNLERSSNTPNEVPNSFANAWNNLVPKKVPPIIEDKVLIEETNKKIIWKNFSIKYLVENFKNASLRFKLVVLVLIMVLVALLSFLVLAYIAFNATQNLKALDKNLELIESRNPVIVKTQTPVFPNVLEIKDQESPLNGELFTPTDFNNFVNQRPYAITIDNEDFARAQMSGLISADIVYEFPTEGFTNRFLGIFWSRKPSIIGPVRSVRTYMMDVLPDNDAILNHFGQSSLEPNKSYRESEIAAVDAPLYFSKHSVDHTECGLNQDKSLLDLGIPIEHTYFTSLSTLNDCIPAGWVRTPTITNYLYKTDIEVEQRPIISEVSVGTDSSSKFLSRWVYNPTKNSYSRYQSGVEHHERELGIITAKNIIIQYVRIDEISDNLDHLNLTMIGEGEAIILFDGKVIKGRWVKPDRNSRTRYYNANGEEIRFNRGKFWIYAVPSERGSAFEYNISFK